MDDSVHFLHNIIYIRLKADALTLAASHGALVYLRRNCSPHFLNRSWMPVPEPMPFSVANYETSLCQTWPILSPSSVGTLESNHMAMVPLSENFFCDFHNGPQDVFHDLISEKKEARRWDISSSLKASKGGLVFGATNLCVKTDT